MVVVACHCRLSLTNWIASLITGVDLCSIGAKTEVLAFDNFFPAATR